MNLGNREKIVFGSITLILTIAALHFFIFSPKARQLSQAKKSYNQVLRQYNQVGSMQSPSELRKYEDQTKQYEDELVRVVRALNLAIPQYNIQSDPESVEKRRQDFLNLIKQILASREEREGSKLSFLGEKGWDIPSSLPENIEKRRINLWDLVSKLDAIHSILDVIANETVKQTKEEERRQLLLQLGYDQQKVASLVRYGSYVPLVKSLVHAQLIMDQKPEEYRLTKEKLYELLRIEFPDNVLVYINKQLYALTDLLSMARANKIDDIIMVRLLPKSEVFKEIEQQQAPQQPGAPAAPAPAGRPAPAPVNPDMWAGAMAMAAGEGGVAGPAAQAVQATPAPPSRKLVCAIMPIQLRFSGTNLNAMKFLYEITHSMRAYAIDDLAIQSLDGSNVDVFVTVNVLVYVDGVSFEVQPAG